MNSLIDLLQEHHVEYKEAGESSLVTSGWIGVICPYCGIGTGKHGMGLRTDSGTASCWKCGVHPLVEVLHELTKVSYVQLRDFVRGHRRAVVSTVSRRGRLVLPPSLGKILPARGSRFQGGHGLLPIHRRYLQGRGFDPEELVRLWGICGIGLASKLAWRLFLPALFRSRVVSWTTRAVDESAPLRYISAAPHEEELPLKSLLYGEDFARNAIIVCEGSFDAIRIGPGAVATCGVSYTREQVLKMSRYPLRVICFDTEFVAQQRAESLCNELSVFPGTTKRVQIDSPDPGSASPHEVKLLRKEYLE